MMAAMHHVNPTYLERVHANISASEQASGDALAAMQQLPADLGLDPLVVPENAAPGVAELARSFAERFVNAWREHLAKFSTQPTAAQIQRFEERVRGINVR